MTLQCDINNEHFKSINQNNSLESNNYTNITKVNNEPKSRQIHSEHRVVNYLRISVTDRCNLACRYCVPKEILPNLHHEDIARYEEIHRIVVSAAELGISKIRITGGEPLVRKGIFSFIKGISQINGIQEISLTTNGVMLKDNLDKLIDSGIHRVNISLDTLKPEKFRFISGKDYFHKVWEGIMLAIDKGLSPVKLNAVILRGINDDEIEQLSGLSTIYPVHMRFIEYMPMGNSSIEPSQQILIPEIKERIEKKFGTLESVEPAKESSSNRPDIGGALVALQKKHAGPAKRFKIRNAPGEIGFISPVSSHFCHECNRLRLTSTGKLRPCLLNNTEIDILTPLRQGATREEIEQIFMSAVKRKPSAHSIGNSYKINGEKVLFNKITTQMSTIGG
ncbi:Molybdenum cofactor biosynthesis protein A [Desulfamplus magnetovallimortis]|uniref:Molybdenum cofactor biosynthesis protein A n=1 Tax=Desulfamplus magnetovallimortis TaxID=1246637 RepID=A0A1W1H5I8_9BACT|nr:GTP 3',8-cyclase MoaA [Desulfamplus magnetovallimortis]SLM27751.1 Molybdenum cofactor biosynthesis protein A [Desulfamplus magnetovallimortis]